MSLYPPYNFLLQIDLLQVRVKVVPYTFQAEVRYKLALCIYTHTHIIVSIFLKLRDVRVVSE